MTSTEGISYELAKRLKEHGFPQMLGGKWIDEYGDITQNPPLRNKYASIPSLSELIAECGDDFGMMFHGANEGTIIKIDIENSISHKYKWASASTDEQYMAYGKSPEEAVANLYLAIHPLSGGGNNK